MFSKYFGEGKQSILNPERKLAEADFPDRLAIFQTSPGDHLVIVQKGTTPDQYKRVVL